MKTNLLSLFIVLLLALSCTDSNNASVKDEPKTSTTKNESKTLTIKEALINEGWSELATVSTVSDRGNNSIKNEGMFTVFFKDEYYVALECRYMNNTGGTRHSVTKGNYRICNKIYNGRISYYGRSLYFNF